MTQPPTRTIMNGQRPDELTCLLEATQALRGQNALDVALREILSLLNRHLDITRGRIDVTSPVWSAASVEMSFQSGGIFGREWSASGKSFSIRVWMIESSPTEPQAVLDLLGILLSQHLEARANESNPAHRAPEGSGSPGTDETVRFRPGGIMGNSKAMQEVYEQIRHVTQSDTSVLILGESGVGKELVANAIHRHGGRSSKPFIKVNCAALPETLLESELFGHERGSFTGAIQQKKGRFELAHGGTLFLDEVGDFSPSTQVKLLRVLQEKEFERLGGTSTIKADVRIIAATNRNLEELIAQGRFRQDLYYRLNVFPIHVPPLRERKADVLLLADYFVEKYNKALKKNVRRISTPAIDMLMSYHWPGNVRELENCIERAVLISPDHVIHSHHLPPTLQTAETSGTRPKGTLQAALETLEREMLVDALKALRGNMAQAARELGLSERMMGLRVRKYSINPKRFRE